MNGLPRNLLVATVFAIGSLLATAPPDDHLIRDPGKLAGPWEGKSGDSLVGLYFLIDTTMKGSEEYWTSLQVRVDQFLGSGGWFVIDGGVATWDGARLKIDFSDPVRQKKVAINLVFDWQQQSWSGTFGVWAGTLGASRTVRLERPRMVFDPKQRLPRRGPFALKRTVRTSPFFGTWKSNIERHSGWEFATVGCLHVAVRRNGSPVGWLDHGRFDFSNHRRYGEMLLLSIERGISFTLDRATGLPPSYAGRIVENRRIEGEWSPGFALAATFMRSEASSRASLPIPVLASGRPFLVTPSARNSQ